MAQKLSWVWTLQTSGMTQFNPLENDKGWWTWVTSLSGCSPFSDKTSLFLDILSLASLLRIVFDVFVEQWRNVTDHCSSKLDVEPNRSVSHMERMLCSVRGLDGDTERQSPCVSKKTIQTHKDTTWAKCRTCSVPDVGAASRPYAWSPQGFKLLKSHSLRILRIIQNPVLQSVWLMENFRTLKQMVHIMNEHFSLQKRVQKKPPSYTLYIYAFRVCWKMFVLVIIIIQANAY